jgi:hypothetical protein
MNINTDHLHHWMNAIRASNNPMRTLEAFYAGQIKSKEWLIEHLANFIPDRSTVEIHGGWAGVLASMLFQTPCLNIHSIVSVDIDPLCKHVAEEMNRIEFHQGRFNAETGDMCNRYPVTNVVINTSCEHITQEQYDAWLNRMLGDQLIVLQSNNYNIPEHIRISTTLDDFKNQSKLSNICFSGELELSKYKRFMIIGKK